MKTSSQYSAIITLLIMLFVAAGILLSLLVNFRYTILEYLVPAVLVVVGSFFTIKLFFNRFVEQKINPIFKTIHSHTLSQQELRSKIDQQDIVKELNREVQIWANNQTEEIKKLKELEKYRKDFLGNVSHELKTPIFNVQGYILTLLDGGMEDTSVNRLYLKRAEKSINRLISIVAVSYTHLTLPTN